MSRYLSATLALTLTTLIALPIVAQESSEPEAEEVGEFAADEDRMSYAVGLGFARSLRAQGMETDDELVLAGVRDGLQGEPRLSDEELQRTMIELQQKLRAEQEAMQQALGGANLVEGEAFLAANKEKDGVVSLESGLQYEVLEAGSGPKPVAEDRVSVHYRGTLLDGTEFDSSHKRGAPATFPLNRVIRGWTEAVQLMPVGSKWRLFIPSALAYGERAQGAIPPNATLIFEVELLEILDEAAVEASSPEE